MTTEMSGTLPHWAMHFREPLDQLRKFVARTPELRALGTVFGPTRILSRSEAERIIEAFRQRQREKVATVA